MNKMRVRYAPSPTGYLHIGNARTALFNYIFARHYGADFMIRIEDTDKTREVEGGEDSQVINLEWLGIDWDESPREPKKEYAPYRQSERLDIYHEYALKLVESGKAYYSYMSEDDLEKEREDQKAAGHLPRHVYEYEGMTESEIKEKQNEYEKKGIKPTIRIHVLEDHVYEWDDLVKGKISFIGKNVGGGDWIIEKANGTATYNFCVVVDDHLMDITHVIRGDDHVNNTPKQLMIFEAFDWEVPAMAHMPLVLNSKTGKKLSKRDKKTVQFIEEYREKGYVKEAVFNFIASLGWNAGGTEEIYSKEEIIKLFEIEKMSGAPASFDQNKLNWMNEQYLKKMDDNTFIEFAKPFILKAGGNLDTDNQLEINRINSIIKFIRPQIQYGEEIIEATKLYFGNLDKKEDIFDLSKITENENSYNVIKTFYDILNKINNSEFNEDNILKAVKETQKETSIKGRELWSTLYASVIRNIQGPQLGTLVELLGKTYTLKYINEFLEQIK